MALIVGIKNGTDKGFTEDEVKLTNSFGMGILAMVTGVGNIGGKEDGWRTRISVQEAHDRFTVALEALEIFQDQEPVKEVITLDFVQRMADADWSCNVGNESKEEFLYKMAGQVMSNLLSETRTETLGTHYRQKSWDDLRSRRESVRMLVGMLLSEDEDEDYYMTDCIDSIVHNFDFYDDKEFYGNKYLYYNESTHAYTLVNEVPNEEE